MRDQERPVEDVRQLVRDRLRIRVDLRPQRLVVVPPKMLRKLARLDQERECLVLEPEEVLTTGVADALAVAPDGSVEAVIDWKSDVRASDNARAHYAAQVRTYMRLVGAARGLVVYATTGAVETV